MTCSSAIGTYASGCSEQAFVAECFLQVAITRIERLPCTGRLKAR